MWERYLTLIDTIGSLILGGALYVIALFGVLHDLILESRDGFTMICLLAMMAGMGLAGYGLWRLWRSPRPAALPGGESGIKEEEWMHA